MALHSQLLPSTKPIMPVTNLDAFKEPTYFLHYFIDSSLNPGSHLVGLTPSSQVRDRGIQMCTTSNGGEMVGTQLVLFAYVALVRSKGLLPVGGICA